MRAALRSILAVDKRVVLFAVVAGGVGDDELKLLILQLDGVVQHLVFVHIIAKKVIQTVFGEDFLSVEMDGKPTVEVGVIPHHFFDILGKPAVVDEDRVVDDKGGESTGTLVGEFDGRLVGELSAGELSGFGLSVAETLHFEVGGKGVDGFHTHTVLTDGVGESLAVELAAGVDLGDAVHHLVERDAAAVVAHRHDIVLDGDLDRFAMPLHKLVDGVVDDLFEEHVDTVVVGASVAQFADIHAGTEADMFIPFEGDNVGVVVIFSHLL